MKKIILLILIHLSINLSAQLPKDPVSILSPNATEIAQYGEVPVSLFTGIPSIEIPIYTIKDGNYELPISLSYHASGIRPEQHPGWVGLGWNLNAGGVISRVIKDMPDEYNIPQNPNGTNAGFYYKYKYLNLPYWNSSNQLNNMIAYWYSEIDSEPDVFNFNFPGYNGQFILNTDGTWQIKCDKPIQVCFDSTFYDVPNALCSKRANAFLSGKYFPSFSGFTITAEDGTKYIFGKNPNAIEYSIGFFNQGTDYWVANSWYLTKIVQTNNSIIDFSYLRGDLINEMYISISMDIGSYLEGKGYLEPKIGCPYSYSGQIISYYNGKLISPVYLNNIKTYKETVVFDHSVSKELGYDKDIYLKWKNLNQDYLNFDETENPFLPILRPLGVDKFPDCLDQLQWRKLDNISIINNSEECNSFFHFNYNNNPNQRLMLLSLENAGINNSVINKYQFEYFSADSLPGYLSNKTDHWGYYNGTYAYYDKPTKYYSYREPNANTLLFGTLSKIVYPTGGYTRFEFEPHKYGKQLKLNRWEFPEVLLKDKIAGGLRIKKIINSPSGKTENEIISKQYYYTTDYDKRFILDENSSGILGGRTFYCFQDFEAPVANDKRKYIKNLFSSQSVLPACNNSLGSHIGYTKVTEVLPDNSYTTRTFTNFDNGHLDEEPAGTLEGQERISYYEPYNSKEQERGKLLSEEEFLPSGIMKRKVEYTYEKDKVDNNFAKSFLLNYEKVCSSNYLITEAVAYKLYCYNYRISQVKEQIFDNPYQQPLETRTSYKYNNYNLPTFISNSTNDGIIQTQYRRAEEYTAEIYKSMIANHVLSPVVEELKTLIKNDGIQQNLEHKRCNFFHFTGTPQNLFVPCSIEYAFGNSPLEKRITYHKYDSKGNPVYLTKDGVMNTVYLWDSNQKLPVAKIEGLTYEQVESVLGQSIITGCSNDMFDSFQTSIYTNFPEAVVTAYKYNSWGGMTSQQSFNGVNTYYEYDKYRRLEAIKDGDKWGIQYYQYHYKTEEPEK